LKFFYCTEGLNFFNHLEGIKSSAMLGLGLPPVSVMRDKIREKKAVEINRNFFAVQKIQKFKIILPN